MSKLSSTSSLVLLWANNYCYQSKNAKAYLELLDLESGNKLHEECLKIWQFYDEVIKNRKFGVIELIKDTLSETKNIKQVIIAGAGFDALGIEVLDFFPQIKVFEIDIDNMETKENLVSKVQSLSKSNISFISVNLSDTTEVKSKLFKNGWNPKKPTLLILEGISYYLSTKTIQELFNVIKPKRTVFEFFKHNNEVIKERAYMAEEIFELISFQCNCSDIVHYNYSEIENSFNLPILKKYSMQQLELERTGVNMYFQNKISGWIDVCLLGNNDSDSIQNKIFRIFSRNWNLKI